MTTKTIRIGAKALVLITTAAMAYLGNLDTAVLGLTCYFIMTESDKIIADIQETR